MGAGLGHANYLSHAAREGGVPDLATQCRYEILEQATMRHKLRP